MVYNYLQNNNSTKGIFSTSSMSIKKLVILFTIIGVLFSVVALVIVNTRDNLDSNTRIAREAARKEIPNAEIKQLIIADGFAKSILYVPNDKSQLGSGNVSYFRVNQDGSMTYITSASYFSPLDLLGVGIPLETQAKLNETDLQVVRQDLADVCSYNGGNTPGFIGFDGSFNPGGWQIDQTSFDGIKNVLKNDIKIKNLDKKPVDRIICINAILDGSNVTTDKSTDRSSFLVKLRFVTGSGTIASHDFTFSDGPVYSRVYTLDGQKVQIN